MIVDSEDEFRPEEVEKLRVDVTEKGLSVLVMAEWCLLKPKALDLHTETVIFRPKP